MDAFAFPTRGQPVKAFNRDKFAEICGLLLTLFLAPIRRVRVAIGT